MRCTMLHYIHSLQFSLFGATLRPVRQANQDALWHKRYAQPNIWFGGRDRSGDAWLGSLTCAPHRSDLPLHTHSPLSIFDKTADFP